MIFTEAVACFAVTSGHTSLCHVVFLHDGRMCVGGKVIVPSWVLWHAQVRCLAVTRILKRYVLEAGHFRFLHLFQCPPDLLEGGILAVVYKLSFLW